MKGLDHRGVIKVAIVVVIVVTVIWSIVNVSEYAHRYHSGLVVYSLGASVGTANALSVYAFVIARARSVKVAAVVGVVLFGAMSGTLQMLLYVMNGAPWIAAIAFGWFGPVAEGVLSWLHAVLSEEQAGKTSTVKPAKTDKRNVKTDKQNVNLTPVDTSSDTSSEAPDWLTELVNLGDTELGKRIGVSRQSIYTWRNNGKLVDKLLERLPEPATVTSNGTQHS